MYVNKLLQLKNKPRLSSEDNDKDVVNTLAILTFPDGGDDQVRAVFETKDLNKLDIVYNILREYERTDGLISVNMYSMFVELVG